MATTPYNLLVDVGNTFVKWGRYRATGEGSAADNCLESGHALLAEIPEFAAAWRKLPCAAPHRHLERRRHPRALDDDPRA